MDIVDKLRRYRPTYGWPEEGSVIVEPTMNHVAADEIERLREVLQTIAAIDTEKITSALGSVIATKLWVKLNECVELSRKALGEKE